MPKTVYVLNGPNMNLLGTREPEKYGRATLEDVEVLCKRAAERHGMEIAFHASNHEGALVDWIQEAGSTGALGIVINGAGFTTTSIAIHDAIIAVRLPVIEVHITNIYARESFRHHSMIAPVARATMAGFGVLGYAFAIEALAAMTAQPQASA